MPEYAPLVLSYSHLRHLPREKDALLMLRKVASMVKPLMRARGWKVGALAEFYPEQQNLLGLNINHGQKVLLRLRFPNDSSLFLPMDQIIDTMLHELSHIVHGPHDAKFHALWNQLRDEQTALALKGYTGEGFLGKGYRLGGHHLPPMHEARRVARAAAEKRQKAGQPGRDLGRRLGGAPLRPDQDIRQQIAAAAERRLRTLRGCGNASDKLDEGRIAEISDAATRDGIRTQPDEDAANEAAIAQALWELVQEDEKAKWGSAYKPPTAEDPTGSGGSGGAPFDEQSEGGALPGGDGPKNNSNLASSSMNFQPSPPPIPLATKPAMQTQSREPTTAGWSCDLCTLHNPANYLCCDACGTERTFKAQLPRLPEPQSVSAGKRPRNVVDLTTSPTKPSAMAKKNPAGGFRPKKADDGLSAAAVAAAAARDSPAFWECSFCGKSMERQWWTCSACGTMKDSSR